MNAAMGPCPDGSPARTRARLPRKLHFVDYRPWTSPRRRGEAAGVETDLLEMLGRRIRQRRRALSLSQEELGHRSGVDRSYISGLERGVRNPTFGILSQIAGALDCGLAQLFSDAGDDGAGEDGGGGSGFAEQLRWLWRAQGE